MVTPLERTFYIILMLGALAISIRICGIRMATIRRGRKPSGEIPPDSGRVAADARLHYGAVVRASECPSQRLGWHSACVDLLGGSIVFLTSYLLVIIAGDAVGLGQSVRNPGIFKSVIFAGDIAGLAIIVGLSWGLLRRWMLKPARLGPDYEVGKFSLIVCSALLIFIAYYILWSYSFKC